jgi:hypothetical protein
MVWLRNAPEVRDEATNRLIQPEGPCLHVRYRSTGAEWEFWPVSEDEARSVMNPGALYNYSIGTAYGSIIKAHKSGRMVAAGERMETVRQRKQQEGRAGRRWLA